MTDDMTKWVYYHDENRDLQKRELTERDEERLLSPLKNRRVVFMSNMMYSEIVKEINTFPNSPKVDAIDALANSEFIILENYQDLHVGYDIQGLSELYYHADQLVLEQDHSQNQAMKEEMALRNKVRNEMRGGYEF